MIVIRSHYHHHHHHQNKNKNKNKNKKRMKDIILEKKKLWKRLQ